MKKVQQDVMCVLLQTLLDKELITQNIYDKSHSKILDTFDSADFFCYSEDVRKEESHGHTQNSC